MAARKADGNSVRSGRITGDDVSATAPLTIIKRAGSFRIFNAGKSPNDDFDVKPDSGTVTVLKRRSSMDIGVGSQLAIERTVEGKVRGMYDSLGTDSSTRSGRFKAPANGDGLTIVRNRSGVLYRVFNSGKVGSNPFDVHFGGVAPISLEARISVDVCAIPNIVIKRNNNQPVAGIYDHLAAGRVIQSGRFGRDMATTAARHTIIDFTNGSTGAFYRILNSGETAIVVRLGATVLAAQLKPDQSMDFSVPGGGVVTVGSFSGANTTIEGIYEFLPT